MRNPFSRIAEAVTDTISRAGEYLSSLFSGTSLYGDEEPEEGEEENPVHYTEREGSTLEQNRMELERDPYPSELLDMRKGLGSVLIIYFGGVFEDDSPTQGEPTKAGEWRSYTTTANSLRVAIRNHTRSDGTVDMEGLADAYSGGTARWSQVNEFSIARRPHTSSSQRRR